MTFQEQVISPETSRKLADLGVKQESMFFYAKSTEGDYRLYPLYISLEDAKPLTLDKKEGEYAAFTAAEILDLMPGRNKRWDIPGKWSNDWWLEIKQSWGNINDRKPNDGMQNTWMVNYYSDTGEPLIDEKDFGKNLAEQAAKVMIYLYENNLMKS